MWDAFSTVITRGLAVCVACGLVVCVALSLWSANQARPGTVLRVQHLATAMIGLLGLVLYVLSQA